MKPLNPLSLEDIAELNRMAIFVNSSFIITTSAILESYGVGQPDCSIECGDHVQLVRWLRNRFAHGEFEYDPNNSYHVETRELLEMLFPEGAGKGPGFFIAIDSILEPLKEGVLKYVTRI